MRAWTKQRADQAPTNALMGAYDELWRAISLLGSHSSPMAREVADEMLDDLIVVQRELVRRNTPADSQEQSFLAAENGHPQSNESFH